MASSLIFMSVDSTAWDTGPSDGKNGECNGPGGRSNTHLRIVNETLRILGRQSGPIAQFAYNHMNTRPAWDPRFIGKVSEKCEKCACPMHSCLSQKRAPETCAFLSHKTVQIH